MDQERARIQTDLQGLLDGDIHCDEMFSQLYAGDASIYEIRPLGVVRPKHTKDVVACVKYANENNVPLIARGAGTGLAGEAIGKGLVIDFSYYMRRLINITDDAVRVQPGLVLAQLNQRLAAQGRVFGPDPATRSVTTMGSVLALDASGSHWMQFGSARDKVISMQVVLGDGRVIQAGREDLNASGELTPSLDIAKRVQHILSHNEQAIEQSRPQTKLNRSGYHLHDLVEGSQFNLAKLLVGSEGTLGFVTEATIQTDKQPLHRGVALLFCQRLEKAAEAAIEIGSMGASACDLMDRRLLSIARKTDRRFHDLIPDQAEAMLLVEFSGDELDPIREKLQQVISRIQRRRRYAFEVRSTVDIDERNLYWRLIRRVVPRLYRLEGNERPVPVIEDIVVPPKNLPAFLTSVQKILQSLEVTASVFAHAAHGQIHLRPFLNLSDPQSANLMQKLADQIYEQTLQVGGLVSGEHGDGLSRTWFLRRQFKKTYPVFRDIKRIFDPTGIMNPGKIVADLPQPLTKNLREILLDQELLPATVDADQTEPDEIPIKNSEAKKRELPVLNMDWTPQEFANETRSCNGCGRCRTTSLPERMCPIFRIIPAEEASPRAKANLMRAILTGQLHADTMKSDAFKQVADLCVNCHQCRLECPAGTDIPKMMIEAKSQYVSVNGMKLSESMFANIDGFCRMASRFELLSNWIIGNRTCRWVLEKFTGIAQGRKLPRVSSRSFLRNAIKLRLAKPTRNSGRKVLYFVDSYANWIDTDLGMAFVKTLQHNGVEVFVHPRQRQSGMSLISSGATDKAKKNALKNIELLVDAIRQGYHIVATEPAAALCLKKEYINLFDNEDTQLIAENSSEACHYLWKMHEQGELALDFMPVNAHVGYHLPCHQRALENGAPGERLLNLIPGLTQQRLEKGCSGMAGTYGLSRKNFRRSIRIGRDLINAVRQPNITVGTTECSACKVQMEQGTPKATLHPIKLMAYAYRLMPQVEAMLQPSSDQIYVS